MLIVKKLRSLQNGRLVTWRTPQFAFMFLVRLVSERVGAIQARGMPHLLPVEIEELQISVIENESELPRILCLYDKYFNDDLERAHLQKLYQQFPHLFFVVRKDGQIVGYSIYKIVPTLTPKGIINKKACLFSIAVDRDFQGHGLAKWLLIITLGYLAEQSIWRVYLFVPSSNVTAIKLYQSLGFRVQRIVAELGRSGRDLWLMETEVVGDKYSKDLKVH